MRTLKPDEIEVRVGQVGFNKKTNQGYATLLLYKNARTDMQVLDETFGAMNWQKDYKEIKGNLYCGVGIYDEAKKEWVWKWDCGTESNTEKEKGEASDAFKRACVNVSDGKHSAGGVCGGIGRELYTAPMIYIEVAVIPDQYNNGKYKLANPAELRGMYVSHISYTKDRKISDLDIAIKGTIIWSTDKRKVGTKNE